MLEDNFLFSIHFSAHPVIESLIAIAVEFLRISIPGGRWSIIHLQCKIPEFDPWVGKIPWRREWVPTPVFLPGESLGQRGVEDYSL